MSTSKNKSSKYIVDSDEEAGKKTFNKEESQPTKLSEKKRVTVREWKNMVLIDIREFFEVDGGTPMPTKKGISLQLDQWDKLKSLVDDIDEEIKNLK
ncbi:20267_t:CDS:2 [Entrophospora sp. SA101]|nr:20267_t:CDS:2 [Entrophospora sp. SA101]